MIPLTTFAGKKLSVFGLGASGLTMGPLAGSLAAQAALGLPPAIDLEPFAPLPGRSGSRLPAAATRPESSVQRRTQRSGRAGSAREDKPVPRAAVLASA